MPTTMHDFRTSVDVDRLEARLRATWLNDLERQTARLDDLRREMRRIDDLRREIGRIDDLRREIGRIDDLRRVWVPEILAAGFRKFWPVDLMAWEWWRRQAPGAGSGGRAHRG